MSMQKNMKKVRGKARRALAMAGIIAAGAFAGMAGFDLTMGEIVVIDATIPHTDGSVGMYHFWYNDHGGLFGPYDPIDDQATGLYYEHDIDSITQHARDMGGTVRETGRWEPISALPAIAGGYPATMLAIAYDSRKEGKRKKTQQADTKGDSYGHVRDV